MSELKKWIVNRVVFHKKYAWYLTIAKVDGEIGCYFSHHDRTGLSDEKAKKAFTNAHFIEVKEQIKQQLNKKLYGKSDC